MFDLKLSKCVIFIHFKLWIAIARKNFKWAKIEIKELWALRINIGILDVIALIPHHDFLGFYSIY